MAGRIRTIKPELLEDSKTARLSSNAFRLFIGLILLADDHGRSRADTIWLRAQVFWGYEPSETLASLREALRVAGLIEIYRIRGQEYLRLRGWTKHQRVDHPSKPRVPGPDDQEAVLILGDSSDLSEILGDPRENLAKSSGTLAPDPDPDHRPPTPHMQTPHADLPVGGKGAGSAAQPAAYIPIVDEDWAEASPPPRATPEPLQLKLLEPEPVKHARIAPEALEAVYRQYPRKEGKKRGLEALGRVLKASQDPVAKLAEVERAIRYYSRLCLREQRDPTKIKHFDTFINSWTDYATGDLEPLPASRPPVYSPPVVIPETERAEVSSMIKDLGKKLKGGF